MSRTGSHPEDPEAGTPRFRGQGGAVLTFLGLGVSQGGTPKDPEKTGRTGSRPGDPEAGTPRFRGRGGFDLFRPRGVIGRGPQGP